MRWGKAGQHGVRLNQCWRRNNHFGAAREPPLNFICSGLMIFVPSRIRPQSCSLYPEERRVACLSGST